MKKLFLLLLVSVFTLCACQDTQKTATAPETPAPEQEPAATAEAGSAPEFLMNKKFILTQVNEAEYTKDNAPFIEFRDALVFGKVCNSFRGPGEFTEDGWLLTVKNAASTQMACIDGEVAALEKTVFRMLSEGARVAITKDPAILKLMQGGDTLTFKLSAAAE